MPHGGGTARGPPLPGRTAGQARTVPGRVRPGAAHKSRTAHPAHSLRSQPRGGDVARAKGAGA
ncbi:hypothetical protein SBRY_10616 [Actinacidiphila bryophytorum]|uniref:Uncharacterized protein n=1 Tax=Actinacidiphila bryophytorum TaxID=1436133 RepID=A0A9W4E657_9ACTN|nr:hypothetical protein SBRY_10616 [Actinacidiphila bryophytorum]